MGGPLHSFQRGWTLALLTRIAPTMHFTGPVVFFAVLALFATHAIATTEWFGDQRAHLNPPKSPPFYDIVYDDYDCPQGIESDAIPEYVYFGPLLSTMTVDDHGACLQRCLEERRCQAVNYFQAMGGYQKRGFCELLSETQRDNPRLMRPFRKATYYEHIQCKTEEDYDTSRTDTSRTRVADKREQSATLKKLSTRVSEFNRRFRSR